MPKLELGDLESVEKAKEANIPVLAAMGRRRLGYRDANPLLHVDVQAGTASDVSGRPWCHQGARCDVRSVRISDAAPQGRQTEYGLQTGRLGEVAYQVPCHLRVQNIGLKTRDLLELVPDTKVHRHRAVFGPRRYLCGQEGVPRDLQENRASGRRQGEKERGGSLHQRLPDGGRANRAGSRWTITRASRSVCCKLAYGSMRRA